MSFLEKLKKDIERRGIKVYGVTDGDGYDSFVFKLPTNVGVVHISFGIDNDFFELAATFSKRFDTGSIHNLQQLNELNLRYFPFKFTLCELLGLELRAEARKALVKDIEDVNSLIGYSIEIIEKEVPRFR